MKKFTDVSQQELTLFHLILIFSNTSQKSLASLYRNFYCSASAYEISQLSLVEVLICSGSYCEFDNMLTVAFAIMKQLANVRCIENLQLPQLNPHNYQFVIDLKIKNYDKLNLNRNRLRQYAQLIALIYHISQVLAIQITLFVLSHFAAKQFFYNNFT